MQYEYDIIKDYGTGKTIIVWKIASVWFQIVYTEGKAIFYANNHPFYIRENGKWYVIDGDEKPNHSLDVSMVVGSWMSEMLDGIIAECI